MVLAFSIGGCTDGNDKNSFKPSKDENYWVEMGEFTGFNESKMREVKRIYIDYEKDVWKKKLKARESNKKLSPAEVQELNKAKTSKLVQLLGFKNFRKIKDYERSLRATDSK